MRTNKIAFELCGVTERDYQHWCRINKKSSTNFASKREFFARIHDGRLLRDASTGVLVKKSDIGVNK